MTVVCNLFGGPGSGKSTTATGVFSYLKQREISCEYVSEYAKDIVWEGITELLNNQIHIFAEQFRRQWRLIGKVDYIITDSPLLLSAVYFDMWFKQQDKPQFLTNTFGEQTREYFISAFNQFDNINWYIHRKKKYDPKGRIQTLEEAQGVDTKIWDTLINTGQKFNQTDSQRSIAAVCNNLLWAQKQLPYGYSTNIDSGE